MVSIVPTAALSAASTSTQTNVALSLSIVIWIEASAVAIAAVACALVLLIYSRGRQADDADGLRMPKGNGTRSAHYSIEVLPDVVVGCLNFRKCDGGI